VSQELEERVKRRTADYLITNQALKQEIASHKQAVDALRLSEDNFRRSINDSPLGVCIMTAEWETIYANRTILDLYGYDSIEELKLTPVEGRYTKKSYEEFKLRNERRKKEFMFPQNIQLILSERMVKSVIFRFSVKRRFGMVKSSFKLYIRILPTAGGQRKLYKRANQSSELFSRQPTMPFS